MTDRHVQKMLTFREMLAVNFAHLKMFVTHGKFEENSHLFFHQITELNAWAERQIYIDKIFP